MMTSWRWSAIILGFGLILGINGEISQRRKDRLDAYQVRHHDGHIASKTTDLPSDIEDDDLEDLDDQPGQSPKTVPIARHPKKSKDIRGEMAKLPELPSSKDDANVMEELENIRLKLQSKMRNGSVSTVPKRPAKKHPSTKTRYRTTTMNPDEVDDLIEMLGDQPRTDSPLPVTTLRSERRRPHRKSGGPRTRYPTTTQRYRFATPDSGRHRDYDDWRDRQSTPRSEARTRQISTSDRDHDTRRISSGSDGGRHSERHSETRVHVHSERTEHRQYGHRESDQEGHYSHRQGGQDFGIDTATHGYSRTIWANRSYESGSYFGRDDRREDRRDDRRDDRQDHRQHGERGWYISTPNYPTPDPAPASVTPFDLDTLIDRQDIYGKYSHGDLLDLGIDPADFWRINLTLPGDPTHPFTFFHNPTGPYHVPESCDYSPCYPATGNLLIGRESQMRASSTCGLFRKERFCIVSHLEDKKKCFSCDSRDQHPTPKESHRIENIVSRLDTRKKTWWQSESGKEFVTIQLDLEAEFHFTHLIIVFKTFRPSAMLIERSYDFGRSWQVYRYFAYDCAESFPGVHTGPARSITDVVCESRYSGVAPSTRGELIYRVLPQNLPINDPYSSEVQELLKMTNLRINFTKLHTLGDNLLDQRGEIKDKYYYAIYDMVVRGSCSCYGHASRCVPVNPGQDYPPDMVHGRCECTHNTKGLNCEQCNDFFNDLPWKPAIGTQTNACKRCNCNEHATRCHFDEAVFKATGNVSGGVCDDCEHNTMGYHCEHCRQFFFRDLSRDITDPYACQPCDCDPRGALDGGVCDSITDHEYNLEAGRCYCKSFVEGRRCDRCREGYWNFTTHNPNGCAPCTCHSLGTVSGLGCNQFTGECTCKRYVTGRDCNQCMPQHWGLSEDRDGCRPCECDPGGAYDDDNQYQCDVITGQCRCRPHVTGRKCDRPDQGYFSALMDYLIYEAELSHKCDNCHLVVREPHGDRESTWTGLGFMRVYEGSKIEFVVDNIQTTMDYDIVVRYEPQVPRTWEEAHVIIERSGSVDRYDKCANTIPQDDHKRTSFPSGNRNVVVFPPACLERGKSYTVRIELRRYDNQLETPSATILIDSIALIPRIDGIPFFQGSIVEEHRRQEFERFHCAQAFAAVNRGALSEVCKKYLFSIGIYVFGEGIECDCDPTGSTSAICDALGGACTCKAHIVGRKCDRCAPGTYGFGPSGCRACDCDSVGSQDNFCEASTGQCKCRQNTYGRQCDECQPGFWNYPSCLRCECHGHADTCDSRTGLCIECRDYTIGNNCDRCDNGYYGDPRLGVNIPCRACPCPGLAASGHSYADSCFLDGHLQSVVCNCADGYAGERCDRCANNYFGNPEVPGGKCEKCSCNNNIDILRPGNCDAKTGECRQCLFNTEGSYCERCKAGFYGDAIHQTCKECVCNILGTDQRAGSCNRMTGQCPCLPSVVGQECDRCEVNHWKLASGEGCEPCGCDRYGSDSDQCNEFDGQCRCKAGFGGRRCNECQQNYWGNPNIECLPCECDYSGSVTQQCHRNNGSCVCLPGIGGDRCNECARGYTGKAPYCDPCGECFDNWDITIIELRDETYRLIEVARRINQTGSTGAFVEEFNEMEEKIQRIYTILSSNNETVTDVEGLQALIERVRQELEHNRQSLRVVDDEVDNTTHRISEANLKLLDLKREAKGVEDEANALKKKARDLQEADVDGALTIIQEAHRQSMAAQAKVDRTEVDIEKSVYERRRTENIIEQGEEFFNRTFADNEASLNDIAGLLTELEEKMPELNNKVCDGWGDPCDSLCGGAGCNKCGGLSCDNGAITKANNALALAEDAEKILRDKEKEMAKLQNDVLKVKRESDIARDEAQIAYDKAAAVKNYSETIKSDLDDLLDRIEDFLSAESSKPHEIRTLAEEVLNKSISLQPEQIRQLARKINQTIANLTNIDAILAATAGDLRRARALKERADKAKMNAEEILTIVEKVIADLEEASKAQASAKEAIDKANKDIGLAELDLTQIASETSAAQEVTNRSVEEVEALKAKLAEIKRKFVENEINVNRASTEATVAGGLSMQAEKDAKDLEDKYKDAIRLMDDKAKVSGEAKAMAEALRDRANRLAHNTTAKLQELKNMEDEFNTHERKLHDFSEQLERLNEEMSIYLEDIETKSIYYRDCQT